MREAERDGLTAQVLQTDIELRLRQAGVPILTPAERLATPGRPLLYLNLNAFKLKGQTELYAYSMSLVLKQRVAILRDASTVSVAGTWSATSSVGTIGADRLRSLRDDVRDMVDEFINAYLSMNPKESGQGCVARASPRHLEENGDGAGGGPAPPPAGELSSTGQQRFRRFVGDDGA